MIRLQQVGQFMDNYIINHKHVDLDQLPAEGIKSFGSWCGKGYSGSYFYRVAREKMPGEISVYLVRSLCRLTLPYVGTEYGIILPIDNASI